MDSGLDNNRENVRSIYRITVTSNGKAELCAPSRDSVLTIENDTIYEEVNDVTYAGVLIVNNFDWKDVWEDVAPGDKRYIGSYTGTQIVWSDGDVWDSLAYPLSV